MNCYKYIAIIVRGHRKAVFLKHCLEKVDGMEGGNKNWWTYDERTEFG